MFIQKYNFIKLKILDYINLSRLERPPRYASSLRLLRERKCRLSNFGSGRRKPSKLMAEIIERARLQHFYDFINVKRPPVHPLEYTTENWVLKLKWRLKSGLFRRFALPEPGTIMSSPSPNAIAHKISRAFPITPPIPVATPSFRGVRVPAGLAAGKGTSAHGDR